MHRGTGVLGGVLIALAIAAPALSEGGPEDSFDGSCALQGSVHFTPPVTNTQAALTYDYAAQGTCSGTLDAQQVTDAPVTLRHAGPAESSCLSARTTAPGHGTIAFAGGTTIRYTVEFTGLLTEVDFALTGERSGTAGGHGSFLTTRTSPDVVSQCGGEGASDVPLDMSLSTDAPLVSERPAPQDSDPAQTTPPSGPRGRLHLSVRPRRARAGRRTRFVFRVTGPEGRPVDGALVRFAGHRARTGPAGAASIVASLPRRSRWRALAGATGLRGARVTVARSAS